MEKTHEELLAELEDLKKQFAEQFGQMTAEDEEMAEDTVPSSTSVVAKNHRPVKPKAGRYYKRLSDFNLKFGVVPQQQKDLAAIFAEHCPIGEWVPEEVLFNHITADSVNYNSLRTSKQSATYLFTYYRGLNKKNGKHLGFIYRNFLVMRDV